MSKTSIKFQPIVRELMFTQSFTLMSATTPTTGKQSSQTKKNKNHHQHNVICSVTAPGISFSRVFQRESMVLGFCSRSCDPHGRAVLLHQPRDKKMTVFYAGWSPYLLATARVDNTHKQNKTSQIMTIYVMYCWRCKNNSSELFMELLSRGNDTEEN